MSRDLDSGKIITTVCGKRRSDKSEFNLMAFDNRTAVLEQEMQNLSLGARPKDLSLSLEIEDWSGSKQGFLDQI